MNLTDYQQFALRTASPGHDNIKHASCGLVTEVAELVDSFKRHWFYGTELDLVNIKEEVGDVLWYLAIGNDALGVPMDNFSGLLTKEVASDEEVLARLVRKASDIFFFYNSWQEKEGLPQDFNDLLGYLRMLCNNYGIDINQCAQDNITKLQKRYPDNFTQEAALNRDKENELSHIRPEKNRGYGYLLTEEEQLNLIFDEPTSLEVPLETPSEP